MRPVDQLRRKRLRPGSRRDNLLLPVVALLALAGCEGGYGSKQNDPMFGFQAPPTPAPSGGGSTPATQAAAGSATPSLPASHSVPNQAALAGGTTQPPDDPRSLRIDQAPVVPVRSPGGAARGVAPGNNVQVEGPIPMPDSTSKTMSAPIASAGMRPADGVAAPPPPGGALTFEQAQQQLKQRGVVWQRLETWGDQGQWRFQCSLPVPGKKGLNRTFVTDPPLPNDPLTAVRAVLDKIEKEQH